MRKLGRKGVATLAGLACLAQACAAWADNYSWISTTDGDWADAPNWSPQAVPGSGDNAYFEGNDSYDVTIDRGAAQVNTLNVDNENASLWLVANGYYGGPQLEFGSGSLSGQLYLQSYGSYGCSLLVDNTLNVTSTGYIDTRAYDSNITQGAYVKGGTINNAGLITTEINTEFDSATLNISGDDAEMDIGDSSGVFNVIDNFDTGTFNLKNGGMVFTDSSGLWLYEGSFNFSGGSIYGNSEATSIYANPTSGGAIELYGSHLSTTVSDGGGAVFTGFYNVTMDSDLSKNTTLVMNANGFAGAAWCYVGQTFNNNGTMIFRCNDGKGCALVCGDVSGDTYANSVINNHGTISITDNGSLDPTQAAMYVQSPLVNYGTVSTTVNTQLSANASNEGTWNITNGAWMAMYGTRFNQDSGTLGNGTGTNFYVEGNGGFNYNGGKVLLTVDLYSSYLSTSVTDGQGAEFNMYDNCTLNGNLAPHTIVQVNSEGIYGSGYLNVQNGAHNYGAIYLNANLDSNHGVDVHIGDDHGTLNNDNSGLAFGDLEFEMSNGGFTDFYGNLVNSGTVHLSGSGVTQFNGNITNYGNFTIDSGDTAVLADGYGFFQPGLAAQLNVNGTLSLGKGSALVLGAGSSLHLAVGTMTSNSGYNINTSASLYAENGGHIVSAGGGNIVAGGGGNIIAGGGGNIIAGGGGNIVAGGGGNFTVGAGGFIVAGGGGNADLPDVIRANATASDEPTSSVIVQSGGTITMGGGSISADGAVEIDAGGVLSGYGTLSSSTATNAGKIVATGGTLELQNAQLDNSGLIDVAGGTLQLDQGLVEDVLTQIRSGYDNGKWDGTSGITSSSAMGNSTHGVAYSEDGGAVILMYTLNGDSNMDGAVDSNDFALLAANYGKTGQGWMNGDYNYDGTVNALDFNALATNYGRSLSVTQTDVAAQGLGATVPEPVSAVSLVAALFLGRRRKSASKQPASKDR